MKVRQSYERQIFLSSNFSTYYHLRNLSLEQLAEKCNISWRNLLRIENGAYKNAKFETIRKLIKELEISDEDILKIIKID